MGLRDQVLQLLGQQATNFNPNARQVAHQHGQLFLARQRQQRPAAHDGQLGRKAFEQHHVLPLRAQLVAAVGFHALAYPHQQVFAALSLRHAKAQRVHHFAFGGNGLQIQLGGPF